MDLAEPLVIDTVNTKLSLYTTFQIGGPCKGVITCRETNELLNAVQYLTNNHMPFRVIGGGSNLLISDKGLNYFIIRYINDQPSFHLNNTIIQCSGAVMLDQLAAFAVDNGLEGMIYACGIPGTLGGAIIGNAGAYGKQIGDLLESVLIYDCGEQTIKTLYPQECQFAYRESMFKKNPHLIILEAMIRLKHGNKTSLQKEREEILETRRQKHPNYKINPCAGSVFKNVKPSSDSKQRQSAGWFLEEAGMKNISFGGAKVFPKHANIIIKGDDSCTCDDVIYLLEQMKKAVKEKFDIILEPEILVWK